MTQEGARESARDRMAVGDRDLVAVFGGSLGARRINQAVERAVADWDGPPLVVHHVVGRREWTSEDTGQYGATPAVDYRRIPLTSNRAFLKKGLIAEAAIPEPVSDRQIRNWTDGYSDLFKVLKF